MTNRARRTNARGVIKTLGHLLRRIEIAFEQAGFNRLN